MFLQNCTTCANVMTLGNGGKMKRVVVGGVVSKGVGTGVEGIAGKQASI